ncbi:hypothetical protein BDW72DRAFT_169227 [Aspergillus terricola var. indicus]
MSFLPSIRATTRLSGARATILPRATVSTFHTSAARSGLKEDDDRSPGNDQLKDHYEQEKEAQIKRQKDGQGKWNQNLASSSEASVCIPLLLLPLSSVLHHELGGGCTSRGNSLLTDVTGQS